MLANSLAALTRYSLRRAVVNCYRIRLVLILTCQAQHLHATALQILGNSPQPFNHVDIGSARLPFYSPQDNVTRNAYHQKSGMSAVQLVVRTRDLPKGKGDNANCPSVISEYLCRASVSDNSGCRKQPLSSHIVLRFGYLDVPLPLHTLHRPGMAGWQKDMHSCSARPRSPSGQECYATSMQHYLIFLPVTLLRASAHSALLMQPLLTGMTLPWYFCGSHRISAAHKHCLDELFAQPYHILHNSTEAAQGLKVPAQPASKEP